MREPRNDGEAFFMIDGTRSNRGYASMPRYREPMPRSERIVWAASAICAVFAAAAFAVGWLLR